jgi:DNA excision repair protein ERCC-1
VSDTLEQHRETVPHAPAPETQQLSSKHLQDVTSLSEEKAGNKGEAVGRGLDVGRYQEGRRSVSKLEYTEKCPQTWSDEALLTDKRPAHGTADFLRALETLQTLSHSHILVSPTQRGNPVLRCIRDIPWRFADFGFADFLLGSYTCAFFLSMRFHLLRPKYIYDRVRSLGRRVFRLRILLVLLDNEGGIFAVSNAHEEGAPKRSPLAELEKMCLIQDLTMMVAWNNDEAARILESYKTQASKTADSLQGSVTGQRRTETHADGSNEFEHRGDYSFHRATAFLVASRSVSRTDAAILLRHFGSLRNILSASMEELATVPGIGPIKCAKLFKLFHEPLTKDQL